MVPYPHVDGSFKDFTLTSHTTQPVSPFEQVVQLTLFLVVFFPDGIMLIRRWLLDDWRKYVHSHLILMHALLFSKSHSSLFPS
jgi:hypothetical protein